jgi:hypothetical protein
LDIVFKLKRLKKGFHTENPFLMAYINLFQENSFLALSCIRTHIAYTPIMVPTGITMHPKAAITITRFLDQILNLSSPIPPIKVNKEMMRSTYGIKLPINLRMVWASSSFTTNDWANESIKKSVAEKRIPITPNAISNAATKVTCFFIVDSSIFFWLS